MSDPQHEETFADTERKLREIITTLRAQLAEQIGYKNDYKAAFIETNDDWQEAEARADRAEQRVATLEAALAAQIEVDAGIADECERQNGPLSKRGSDPYVQGLSSAGQAIAAAIRAQPRAGAAEHGSYDRTALDRMLAEAREKALREAYDSLFKHPGFIHAISGQKFKAVKLEDAAEGILALIEKPNAR